MPHFLLIRHGLPHEGHPHHPGDPPLHPLGRRHAERLARQLAREGIDRIVSSPQQRAIDTAAPLARLLGLEPEIHDGLAEVDHGVARYRSVDTVRAEEPERWPLFLQSPARFFGRDPDEYRRHVRSTFDAIVAAPGGERIAVFSHGMTIKTILCAALGVADDAYARFLIAHCSVTRMSGSAPDRLRVDSVNESICKPAPAHVAAAVDMSGSGSGALQRTGMPGSTSL